ncbi:Mononegavirales mRNA-capping region V [Popillia japonica]|uniref:Mononegavirales mRNA-capping region V n=1 Tax=Popillia japonica TaxID=7064 RepID=A0AAW1LIV2_POPJA
MREEKGHPDSLTSYLTTLQLGCEKCDMCKRLYIYLQTEALPLGEDGISPPLSVYRKLLQEQLSIITKNDYLKDIVYRKLLQEQLSIITKNDYLKDIFSKQGFVEDRELMNYLIKATPVFPRFLHEVYRVTEAGTRMSFIAKFCNSRTTQLILTEGKKYKQLRDKIFKLESSFFLLFSYWMKTFNTITSIDLTRPECQAFYKVCPTQVADMLRHYTWLKTLKGSRMIGTTLPHPAHQFKSLMSEVPLPPTDNRQVECITYKLEKKSSKTILETRGSFHPYIGSKTKEKLSGKLMLLPKAHRPIQAAQRASVLNTWTLGIWVEKTEIRLYFRGLTLHELLQSLEEEDDVNTDEVDIVLMPPENCLADLTEEDDVNTDEVDIVLMPPENCLADLTDDDSGDENFVSIDNLPGSQLRAEAEVMEHLDEENFVSIDNLPGSQLRAEAEVMEHLDEELWEEEDNIPLSLVKVAMKKSYEWSCRDLERTSPTWPSMYNVL